MQASNVYAIESRKEIIKIACNTIRTFESQNQKRNASILIVCAKSILQECLDITLIEEFFEALRYNSLRGEATLDLIIIAQFFHWRAQTVYFSK